MLNFMGIGFSFGAKDTGLKKSQAAILKGFEDILVAVGKVNAASGSSVPPPPLPTTEIADLTAAMDTLNSTATTMIGEIGKISGVTVAAGKGVNTLGKKVRKSADDTEKGGAKVEKSLNRVGSSASILDKTLGQLKLGNFVNSISLSVLNNIDSKLKTITEDGGSLSNTLESEAVAVAKTTKQMGQNFGLTGDDIAKFNSKTAGMAKGLNISAEAAGKATGNWMKWGKELRYAGISSATELAKLGEVGVLDAEAFTYLAGRASGILNLTEDQFKSVTASFVAMGRSVGDVKGGMDLMDSTLQSVEKAAGAMGKALSPEDMTRFAKGTAALTAGLFASGMSFEKAKGLAESMNGAIIESFTAFEQLKVGGTQDITDFATALAMDQGSMSAAFDLMKQGPEGLILGLKQMAEGAKKSGKSTADVMHLLESRLGGALGPENAAMITKFMDSMDAEAVTGTMKAIRTADTAANSLASLTKGFSTGRTLAEQYQMGLDRLETRFRSISRPDTVKFVQNSNVAFKQLGDTLIKMGKDDGPLGFIVSKFSLIHQIGAKALLPGFLQPFAAEMGGLVKTLTPVIGALGSMGLNFKMLFNPLTLVTGALAAFLFVSKGAQKRALSMDKGYQKELKTQTAMEAKLKGMTAGTAEYAAASAKLAEQRAKVSGIESEVAESSSETMKKQIGAGVAKAKEVVAGLIGALPGLLQTVSKEIGPLFKTLDLGGILTGLLDTLSTALGDVDWGKVGTTVADALSRLLTTAIGFIDSSGILPRLVGVLLALLNAAVPLVAGLIGGIDWKGLITALVGVLSGVVNAILPVLPDILKGLLEGITAILPGLLDAVLTVLPVLIDGILKMLPQLIDTVLKLVPKLLDALVEMLPKIGDMIVGFIEKLIPILNTALIGLADKLPGIVDRLLPVIVGLVEKLAAALPTLIPAIIGTVVRVAWALLKALPGLVVSVLKAAASILATVFSTIGQTLSALVDGAWTAIKEWFSGVVEWFKSIGTAISDFFLGLWQGVKDAAFAAFDWIKGLVAGPVDKLKAVWGTVSGFFSGIFDSVKTFAQEKLGFLVTFITDIRDRIFGLFDKIGKFIGKVKGFFGGGTVEVSTPSVAASSGEAVATMQATTTAMTDTFGEAADESASIMQESTVSMTQAFDDSLADTQVSMEKTSKAMSKQFQTMLTDVHGDLADATTEWELAFGGLTSKIEDAFTNLWQTLVAQATTMASQFTAEASRVADTLTTFKQGLIDAEKFRQATEKAPPSSTLTASGKAATMADVYSAVHNPNWYREYALLFRQEMADLRATLKLQQAQAAPGSGYAVPTQQRAGVQVGSAGTTAVIPYPAK
jgi:phage-related protein